MLSLQNRIIAWAETQPAIRAVLVVGSRARRDHPGDEWADLDTMVFANDFQPYLSQMDWLSAIGNVRPSGPARPTAAPARPGPRHPPAQKFHRPPARP